MRGLFFIILICTALQAKSMTCESLFGQKKSDPFLEFSEKINESKDLIKEILISKNISLESLKESHIVYVQKDMKYKGMKFIILPDGMLLYITRNPGDFISNNKKRWGVYSFGEIGFLARDSEMIEVNDRENLYISNFNFSIALVPVVSKSLEAIKASIKEQNIDGVFPDFINKFESELSEMLKTSNLQANDLLAAHIIEGQHEVSGKKAYLVYFENQSMIFSEKSVFLNGRVLNYSEGEFGAVRSEDTQFTFSNGTSVKLISGQLKFHVTNTKAYMDEYLVAMKEMSTRKPEILEFIDQIKLFRPQIEEMLSLEVIDLNNLHEISFSEVYSRVTGEPVTVFEANQGEYYYLTHEPARLHVKNKWGEFSKLNINEHGSEYVSESNMLFKITDGVGFTSGKKVVVSIVD